MTTIIDTPTEGREPISLGGTETPEMVAYREETLALLAEKFSWARESADAMPDTPVYHPAPLGPGASLDPVLARDGKALNARVESAWTRNFRRGVPSC